MKKETVDRIRQELYANEYKFTPQRKMVLQVLTEHSGGHLSADEIHSLVKRKYPDIGVATVYRTLDLLASLNIIQKINFGDGKSRFEMSQEERHQHHHLVCLSCNEIIEVKEDLLMQLEDSIVKEYEFEIHDHAVQFFGICRKCQSKRKENQDN